VGTAKDENAIAREGSKRSIAFSSASVAICWRSSRSPALK
jgi:hypothetical protein